MALSVTRERTLAAPAREARTEDLEIRLLLEGTLHQYGLDYRDYDPEALRARVHRLLLDEGVGSVSQFQHVLLRDRACLERFVAALAPRSRGLFDPPGFWRLLRRKILPVLRTYPTTRLWVAGCSGGEEAYSLAIILQEEGLDGRSTVYATDLDDSVLGRARNGRLSARAFESGRRAHRLCGGRKSLQNYGASVDGEFSLDRSLTDRIVFASHSLVTDSSFNEFNVILCRNHLPLFTRPLQDRVVGLLHQSLTLFGFLALESREPLNGSPLAGFFEKFSPRNHVYRRIR